MISNEYNETLTDVAQVDFNAPAQNMGEVAASQSSVEQVAMAASGVSDHAVAKKAVATVERKPVWIASTGKKSSGTIRPPKGRRLVVQTGTMIFMVVVIIAVLAAVIPTGPSQASVLGRIFNPSAKMVTSVQNQTALIAAQAATATAVTVDGYDAGNQSTYAGVQSNFALPDGTTTGNTAAPPTTGAPAVNGSSGGISSTSSGTINDPSFTNWFTAGQCTYWADYEYHHLTGYAVTWSGNASVWGAMALADPSNWNVSDQPHVPSIIVLQPGSQGAGADGHVAVVESTNADGSLNTSNWNVQGWGVFSWEKYSPGAGVQFVWHK